MLQPQKVLTAKWNPTRQPQQKASAQVIAAFKQIFQEPLDSAKRAALCELMKFDLAGIDCMFEEAC
jgi:hypothetical protein